MTEFYIRYERMSGEYYYMIYKRVFVFHYFYERYNTPESAATRLAELAV